MIKELKYTSVQLCQLLVQCLFHSGYCLCVGCYWSHIGSFFVDCSAPVPDLLDRYVGNTEESSLEISFEDTGELLVEITLRSISLGTTFLT